MRPTNARPLSRNMLVTIPGLFLCFMVIPTSSFADPFWSIGVSGGNAGINGFTLSISDYCGGYYGIPVYMNHYGPPCGPACGYYYGYPRRYYHNYPGPYWGRNNYHREGRPPHHMNGPNGYQQDGPRPNSHNQNYNRPNGHQQDGPRQSRQMQNTSRTNRDRQHQWEMSMMNRGMNSPR